MPTSNAHMHVLYPPGCIAVSLPHSPVDWELDQQTAGRNPPPDQSSETTQPQNITEVHSLLEDGPEHFWILVVILYVSFNQMLKFYKKVCKTQETS